MGLLIIIVGIIGLILDHKQNTCSFVVYIIFSSINMIIFFIIGIIAIQMVVFGNYF